MTLWDYVMPRPQELLANTYRNLKQILIVLQANTNCTTSTDNKAMTCDDLVGLCDATTKGITSEHRLELQANTNFTTSKY
jgi:hypothetical protein